MALLTFTNVATVQIHAPLSITAGGKPWPFIGCIAQACGRVFQGAGRYTATAEVIQDGFTLAGNSDFDFTSGASLRNPANNQATTVNAGFPAAGNIGDSVTFGVHDTPTFSTGAILRVFATHLAVFSGYAYYSVTGISGTSITGIRIAEVGDLNAAAAPTDVLGGIVNYVGDPLVNMPFNSPQAGSTTVYEAWAQGFVQGGVYLPFGGTAINIFQTVYLCALMTTQEYAVLVANPSLGLRPGALPQAPYSHNSSMLTHFGDSTLDISMFAAHTDVYGNVLSSSNCVWVFDDTTNYFSSYYGVTAGCDLFIPYVDNPACAQGVLQYPLSGSSQGAVTQDSTGIYFSPIDLDVSCRMQFSATGGGLPLPNITFQSGPLEVSTSGAFNSPVAILPPGFTGTTGASGLTPIVTVTPFDGSWVNVQGTLPARLGGGTFNIRVAVYGNIGHTVTGTFMSGLNKYTYSLSIPGPTLPGALSSLRTGSFTCSEVLSPPPPPDTFRCFLHGAMSLNVGGGSPRLFLLTQQIRQHTDATTKDLIETQSAVRVCVSTDGGRTFKPGVDIGVKNSTGTAITDNTQTTFTPTSYDGSGNPIYGGYYPTGFFCTAFLALPDGRLYINGTVENADIQYARLTEKSDGSSGWRNATTANGSAISGLVSWLSRGGSEGEKGGGGKSGSGSHAIYGFGKTASGGHAGVKSLDGGDHWQFDPVLDAGTGEQIAPGAFMGPGGSRMIYQGGVSWDGAFAPSTDDYRQTPVHSPITDGQNVPLALSSENETAWNIGAINSSDPTGIYLQRTGWSESQNRIGIPIGLPVPVIVGGIHLRINPELNPIGGFGKMCMAWSSAERIVLACYPSAPNVRETGSLAVYASDDGAKSFALQCFSTDNGLTWKT